MQHKEVGLGSKTLAPVEIDRKSLNANGEFEGYASIFGLRDQGDDVVMAGAFRDSLLTYPPDRVKMLWQHDSTKPIGVWSEIAEDGHGLRVKGQLLMAVEKGREAYELMSVGAVDSLSIGYRTIEDRWDRESGTRQLVKVTLREISVVTFPMLEEARVSLVKGNTFATEREFERTLRDAGLSSKQAKAFIAGGYKALTGQRDATEGEKDQGAKEALHRLAQIMRG